MTYHCINSCLLLGLQTALATMPCLCITHTPIIIDAGFILSTVHLSAASTQRRSYRASELAAVMILKRGYEKCLPLLVLHLIQLALPLCGSEAQIPLCNLPMSHGNHCGIVVEQFYYDAAVGQCRGFLYYGCDGNENRFATKSACEEVCSPGRGEAAPLVYVCVCGDE